MKRTAALANFLTILSSKVGIEREGLYQLVQSAEASYYLRDTQKQLEIGLVLQHFPYPFNQVGKYYEAVCLYRNRQYEKARTILESVAECAPSRYRSKALLSLSAVEETAGNFGEALKLRVASCSIDDPLTFIEAQRGIAILRSLDGSHREAIKHLENLLPMAKSVSGLAPSLYPLQLNSLAIEFSEIGKMKEARAVSNLILTSPCFHRFPEVVETVREIHLMSQPTSRLIISFNESSQNVVALPIAENPVIESPPEKPARILSYVKWKKKMVKKPNDDNGDEKNLDDMNDKDLFMELMRVASDDSITSRKLRKMVDAIKKIAIEKD